MKLVVEDEEVAPSSDQRTSPNLIPGGAPVVNRIAMAA